MIKITEIFAKKGVLQKKRPEYFMTLKRNYAYKIQVYF